MRIETTKLKNFLCYYGESTIMFNDGLNLVLGANGYGKSKLYDAFQWVFKDGITSDRDSSGLKRTAQLKRSLISDRALVETAVGSSVNCEVEISISHTRERYKVLRKYNVNRNGQDSWLEAPNSSFFIFKLDVLNYKPIADNQAQELLEKLLPSDVMPYVWFQGERGVNSIIDTNSKEALKRVIEKLSDIEKWDEFIDITTKAYNTTKKEFDLAIKASGNNRKEADEALLEQTRFIEKLARLRKELAESQSNLELAREKSTNVLGKHKSAEKIKELKVQLNDLNVKYEATINEIESFHFQFTRNIFNRNWLLMSTQYLVDDFEKKYMKYEEGVGLRKAQRALGSKVQTRLPNGVPEKMHVMSMLERKHCLVCDRPAPEGSPAYEAIKSLMPSLNATVNMLPDITSDLRRVWSSANSVAESSIKAQEEIRDSIERQNYLINHQKDLKKDIERKYSELTTEIHNSGVENAEDIINTVQMATQDIAIYSENIGRLTRDIDAAEKSLRHFESILKKIGKTDVDPKLNRKLEIMQDLNDLTIRLKDSQYQKLVDLLELRANEHYERINKPTGAFYGKIKFQKTAGGGFIPEIYDDNDRRIENLNTSQTSSMKLAIIMAIITSNHNRGYADKYPLISDAPISDFDEKKSKSFLVEAARTFGQSIVMVMDFLVDDDQRLDRYKPDMIRLLDLSKAITENGNNLTVQQLDLPDGFSSSNREELNIDIRKVSLV